MPNKPIIKEICENQIRINGGYCCNPKLSGLDCEYKCLTGIYNRGKVYYLCNQKKKNAR